MSDFLAKLMFVVKLNVKFSFFKMKSNITSYQKLKRSRWTGTRMHTRKQNQNISTGTAVFLNQKRANILEHTTKMMPSLSCAHVHSLSSDWERQPCPSKCFDFVFVCVFVCLSTMISSIFGKSFHFPFPYFVLFIFRYFPFHVVW